MRKSTLLLLSLFVGVIASATDFTVWFRDDSKSWDPVYAYVYYDDNGTAHETLGDWPGSRMTKLTANDGSSYWFIKFSSSNSAEQHTIIFNNGKSGDGNQTGNLTGFSDGALWSSTRVSEQVFDYGSRGLSIPSDNEDIHDPTQYLSGTLPVLYINVYTDATKTTLNDDIIDINLPHKDYFTNAEYWLDLNGCEWMATEGAASVGSAEAPLPLQIKARGNNTRISYSKKPFKLKLDKKQSLLGLSNSKHFAILAHADDPYGFMRNFVGFDLGKRIGLPWTPSQQPVEVVINGDYRGLYFLTESIRVEADRVNITELDDEAENPLDLTGGYLVELDNYKDDPATIVISETGPLYVTPDTPEIYSYSQKKFITEQFSTMNGLISAHNTDIWKYLQLDDAARYYLVEEIIGHYEAYHGSTYLFRDKAPETGDPGKWSFSPLWDCGHAFDTPADTRFYNYAPYGTTWIKDMLATGEFTDKVNATWLWFMQNEYDGLINDINTYATHIADAAKADYNRWYGVALPTQVTSASGYPSEPAASCHSENLDMTERATCVTDYLNSRLSNMKSWFGDYTSGTYSEPERDTRESAALPDYVKAGYESTLITYTIYFKGDFTPGIWIYDSGNGNKNYTGGNWDARPSMTQATAANGTTYYYYTFKTEDILIAPKVIFTGSSSGQSSTFDFVNGALYSYSGGKQEDSFDPSYLPDHNLSTDPVYIYVYDKAGWGHVDMWLYVKDGDNYTTDNNKDPAKHNGTEGEAWPGVCMTINNDLYYDTYKGLYCFEVPDAFKDGLVIFSNSGNNQYPGANRDGLPIGGKSHLYVNSDINDWIPVWEKATDPEYSGTIPVLFIETVDKAQITDTDNYVTGAVITMLDNNDGFFKDKNGVAVTTDNDLFYIRGRGTTSWSDYQKKPYRIKFDKKHGFGDMPVSKHWLLMPFASDYENGMLANPVGHKLAELAGMEWSPRMEGVELVLNGEYQGLYFITENIRPAGDRVQINDIDDTGYSAEDDWILEIDNSADPTGAYYSWTDSYSTHCVVPESPDLEDFLTVAGNTAENYANYIQSHGEALKLAIEKAGFGHDGQETDEAWNDGWDETWKDLIDNMEAYRFYIVQELMDDIGGYNTNLYLHHTAGSKWKFGPVWNFENAFNSKGSKSNRIYEQANMTWAKELYFNRWFRVGVISLLDKLTGNTGNDSEDVKTIVSGSDLYPIFEFIDSFATKYADAFAADRAHWNNGYQAQPTSRNASTISTLDATTEPTLADYASNVKTYLTKNAEYLLNEGRNDIDGTTGISQTGIEVTDAPVEYYNLQGIRVAKPQPGAVYIVRRGVSVTKELIR